MTLEVTMLVVAKAPVPGLAKTRLAATLGDERAADIAAAALLDTLDAVSATPFAHRVVAMTGDLARAARSAEIAEVLTGFTVIDQRGDDFAARLAHAHADTAAAVGSAPILQIGMDTPQVTADLLTACARALLRDGAVLGMADDGGWWVLGISDAADAEALTGVPMSHAETGRRTAEALAGRGVHPTPVVQLRDLDTLADLDAVAAAAPADGRFAAAVAPHLTATTTGPDVDVEAVIPDTTAAAVR